MDQRRTDTREQIQSVALELFAEKGYDRASLREIAERLHVTKAALYYHFRTKDDILASVIEDFLLQLDALVKWAHEQPPPTSTSARRYSSLQRIADRAHRAAGPLHARGDRRRSQSWHLA